MTLRMFAMSIAFCASIVNFLSAQQARWAEIDAVSVGAQTSIQGQFTIHDGPNIAQTADAKAFSGPGWSTNMNSGASGLSTNTAGTLDVPQVASSSLTQANGSTDGSVDFLINGGSGGIGTVDVGLPTSLNLPIQRVFLYLAAGGQVNLSGQSMATLASGGQSTAGPWFVSTTTVNGSNNEQLWRTSVQTPTTTLLPTDFAGVNRLEQFDLPGCETDLTAQSQSNFTLFTRFANKPSNANAQSAVVSAAWSYCYETNARNSQGDTFRFDFDGSGNVDANDIDLLAAGGRNLDASSDIDGDGSVNLFDGVPVHPMFDLNMDQDVSFRPYSGSGIYDSDDLLHSLGTTYGDANLDGYVNGADFIIWNSNKFQSGTGWGQADFNGDGLTNGVDFAIWNSNKNFSRQTNSVPEPTGSLPALLGFIIYFRKKRADTILV